MFSIAPFRAIAAFAALFIAVAPAAFAQEKTANPIQKAGDYAVELRLPKDGLYAGEEIDLEFRVTNTAKSDPVLGAPGVIRAAVNGVITMPAMASMASAKPKIHREGVPGDYGLVTTFPHGGEYRLALSVTPPGETTPFTVAFLLNVNDEDTDGKRKRAPAPYLLEVTTDPARPVAGQPTKLSLVVRERAGGAIVKDFDIVHEQRMHLIIARNDLGAFFHEHPDLQTDGTFTHEFTFPTGGMWRVFGDAAPSGAGSQVTSATVIVDGDKVKSVPLAPTALASTGEGMTLTRTTAILPAKKMFSLNFTLNDAQGNPITDLQPWLGAMAHLIMIEKDAQTFVHSHPDETIPTNGKNGKLTFLARFPRPGVYKGWVQFQRDGQIKTLPFVVKTTEETTQ